MKRDILTDDIGAPWQVGDINILTHRAYIYSAGEYLDRNCIAEVRAETILPSELKKKAALIAAAPDLLAALIETHEAMHGAWTGLDGAKYYICDVHPTTCSLRAAIAKAVQP